ncbi:MAG: phosphoenolpyruvate carboxylase, partial [Halanaeroarchaeum sp.]
MTLHDRDIERDVEELEEALWAAIRNHESPDVLAAIEAVRSAALASRRGRVEQDAIDRALAGNTEDVNAAVVRALTIYFQLINLAEERARIRTIRENGNGPLSDSIHEAIDRLDARDVSAETIGRVLEDVRVVPTFTAHPTEARRKTIKGLLQRIADHLERLDQRRLTDDERRDIHSRLDAVVEGLWTTKHIRNRSPEPFDEARNVHWYLVNVIMEVIPEVYDEIETRLDEAYDDPPPVPSILSFRSWAGSDADGNPNVTPDVTAETLDRQRRLVLESYRSSLADLESVLTQDEKRTTTDAVERSLEADRERIPGVVESAIDRYPGEPFRQKTVVVGERVDRVDDVKPGGYESVEEFLGDLELLATELRDNDLHSVVDTHLESLMRQVETFGFHLASLDLRDHRELHTEAIAEALDFENVAYREMNEDERVEFLTESILQTGSVIDLDAPVSPPSERVLERFDALADW